MITVDDSIRIIRDAFEIKWRKNLDFAHIQVERYTSSLQKVDLSVMRKFYQNYIDKYQKIADPLSRLEPLLPVAYSDAAP